MNEIIKQIADLGFETKHGDGEIIVRCGNNSHHQKHNPDGCWDWKILLGEDHHRISFVRNDSGCCFTHKKCLRKWLECYDLIGGDFTYGLFRRIFIPYGMVRIPTWVRAWCLKTSTVNAILARVSSLFMNEEVKIESVGHVARFYNNWDTVIYPFANWSKCDMDHPFMAEFIQQAADWTRGSLSLDHDGATEIVASLITILGLIDKTFASQIISDLENELGPNHAQLIKMKEVLTKIANNC